MPEYKYQNDVEREWTQKYEGKYTSEEIKLNRKLEWECSKETINYEIVEELLKRGADPLGGTAICGWDLLEHIYGKLVAESQYSNSVNLPQITDLFLRYGMDIDSPRVPYDGDNSINPLWNYTFAANENSIRALKMLLDHGLSAASFDEFWHHSMTDYFHIDCGDPENDDFWNYDCIWTLKMLLLGASYDHIYETDDHLREFICAQYNNNNIHIFRDWDDFEYHFDTSSCSHRPVLYGSIIHIYSKKTGEEVWIIGVGKTGIEKLKELLQ